MFLQQYQNQDVRIVASEPLEVVAKDIVDILYPLAKNNKNYSTYLDKLPNKYKGSRKIATLIFPVSNKFKAALKCGALNPKFSVNLFQLD